MDIQNSNYPGAVKDEALWAVAKRRAAFKWSLVIYVLVNSMMILIWYFTSGPASYFWPVWAIIGWGLGIAMQYFRAYYGSNLYSVQREYEKLKNQQQH